MLSVETGALRARVRGEMPVVVELFVMSISTKTADHAPSPLVLAEIISQFGDRPDPTQTNVRFPMRGLHAVTHVLTAPLFPLQVEVVELGFSGAALTTTHVLEVGTPLMVELARIACGSCRWPCRVAAVAETGAGAYRVEVDFERGLAPT
jgi:hypothetical protein